MPSRMKTAQNLEDRYLGNAPKKNHEKIKRVLQIYTDNKKVKKKTHRRDGPHGSLFSTVVWTGRE